LTNTAGVSAGLDGSGTRLADGTGAITDLEEEAGAGCQVGGPGERASILTTKVQNGCCARLVGREHAKETRLARETFEKLQETYLCFEDKKKRSIHDQQKNLQH
jgi:hypothetical protein